MEQHRQSRGSRKECPKETKIQERCNTAISYTFLEKAIDRERKNANEGQKGQKRGEISKEKTNGDLSSVHAVSPFPPKRNLKSWQVLTTYDANNPPLLMKHSPLPPTDLYFQFYSAPPLLLPSSSFFFSVCSACLFVQLSCFPARAS